MGRHSARDADLEDQLEEAAEPGPVAGADAAAGARGRHARGDGDGAASAAGTEPESAEAGDSEPGAAEAGAVAAGAVEAAVAEAGHGESGTDEPGDTDVARTDTEPIDLLADIGGQAPAEPVEVAPSEVAPVEAAPSAESGPVPAATTPEKEPPPAAVVSVTPRSPSGTRGDLKLLRQNAALRVRCIGAVVATFLIYTVVLIVIGRTDVYLLWVWIPTVLSGILVGTFLDAAHRRIARASERSGSPAS